MKKAIITLGAALAWAAAAFAATHEGVQLWANGPLWAKTNVGAEVPTETGYYFWWGDTLGYKWQNNQWVASDGSKTGYSFYAPTYGKTLDQLLAMGVTGADGNLLPAFDGAAEQWGDGWRMPKASEYRDLIEHCSWSWTTKNNVTGYNVTGKGLYSANSIFIPVCGYGATNTITRNQTTAFLWSSSSDGTTSGRPCFTSTAPTAGSVGFNTGRSNGYPIRPVKTVRAAAALYMVIDLSGGPDASSYPVSYYLDVPEGGWTDEYKTSKLVLRRIEPGSFQMGCPESQFSDVWRDYDTQEHQVTLTDGFWMGVFQVTQRQWELVTGTNPSYFSNRSCYSSRPVEQVSYEMIRGSSSGSNWPFSSAVDASSFLGKLRAKTGLIFDLPTEAQWEYACRAGTTTLLNNGGRYVVTWRADENMDEVGRYEFNGGTNGIDYAACTTSAGTAQVGSYRTNRWGLYDMHGNVQEWCLDWYAGFSTSALTNPQGPMSGTLRVLRGGSWWHDAWFCCSAARGLGNPSECESKNGLRLCSFAVPIEVYPDVKAVVKFDGNGGNVTEAPKVVNFGHQVGKLPNATRDGFTFTGWFSAAEGGMQVTESTIVMDGRTTYYAHWVKQDVKSHVLTVTDVVATPRYPWNGKVDVSFMLGYTNETDEFVVSLAGLDVDGGTNLPAHTLIVDGVLTNNVRLKAGRHTITWDADADLPNTVVKGVVCSVTAHEPGVLIRFEADGGDPALTSRLIEWGQAIGELPAVTRKGYRFDGWFTAFSDGMLVTSSTVATDDTTYYAHWTPGCSVCFHANGGYFQPNGGGGSMSILYAYGDRLSSTPSVQREGYSFLGWYTGLIGGERLSPPLTVTEDIDLWAHWKADPETPEVDDTWYRITLDANGGQFETGGLYVDGGIQHASSVVVRFNHAYAASDLFWPIPERSHYQFLGWSTKRYVVEPEHFEKVDLSTIKRDMTFYAVWR